MELASLLKVTFGLVLVVSQALMEQALHRAFFKSCKQLLRDGFGDLEGAQERSGSGSEELRSRQEAERTWLQLMRCALVHTVSYFGKPIIQKRKPGESRYSDWRYRRKHLSIYTNYVFRLESPER